MQLKPRDSNVQVAEMVKSLQEYDPESETLTFEDAKDLVKGTSMILFQTWEIISSFLLDQIRRQERSISFEDVYAFGELRGSRFNIDAQTMAISSLAPKNDKTILMEIKDYTQGNVIVSLLGKNKIDMLKEKLYQAYDRYVDTRKGMRRR